MIWLNGEPRSTKNWKQGADGEMRGGQRLAELLDGSDVRLLHDRRIPGHGRANIDHIAIGPGGVTVIDTKTHKGKIRIKRVGGLVSGRREVLVIRGRDQTSLIDGAERQIEHVRDALRRVGDDQLDIRGALCFPNGDGLPPFAGLKVREIIVDGTKAVAKLASRPGSLDSEGIERIRKYLCSSFPPASQPS
jgi:hypothetical protein